VGSGLDRISSALAAAGEALDRARGADSGNARATEVARIREASERAAHGARRVEELLGQRRQDSLESRVRAAARVHGQLGELLEVTADAREAVRQRAARLEHQMLDQQDADDVTAQLRTCSEEEAALQARLHAMGDSVTGAEVRATHLRDRRDEAVTELERIASRLGREIEPPGEPLSTDERDLLEQKLERLARRREALGPVNPLAEQEYADALAHVSELEEQRQDLEAALAELQGLIRDTDRKIRAAFEETFEATERNFEELIEHLFPGGRGRLRLVGEHGPRLVLGGEADEKAEGGEPGAEVGHPASDPAEPDAPAEDSAGSGVEIEVTPAGKATRRLSLLSGGEKALVALAFVFAVFLARPSPFYILDEVEAALDDANIDRFLQLVRRFSGRAQFVIVTHQKRTMDAADVLYGVSMGSGGATKVISRRLSHSEEEDTAAEAAQAA
jgi:chromosome segregation protein